MRLFNFALFISIVLLGYGVTVLYNYHFPPGNAVPTKADAPTGIHRLSGVEPTPEFTFTSLNGKTHNSKSFKGKTVIFNMWASWCAPCVEEFPALLKIAAQNSEHVTLIALSSDKDEAAIRAFMHKLEKKGIKPGKNVLIALDKEDATLKLFGTEKLPESYITGRDGFLEVKITGANWTPEQLQKIIDSL